MVSPTPTPFFLARRMAYSVTRQSRKALGPMSSRQWVKLRKALQRQAKAEGV